MVGVTINLEKLAVISFLSMTITIVVGSGAAIFDSLVDNFFRMGVNFFDLVGGKLVGGGGGMNLGSETNFVGVYVTNARDYLLVK